MTSTRRIVAAALVSAFVLAACRASTTTTGTSGLVVVPAATAHSGSDEAVLLYRSIGYRDDGERGTYDLYVPPGVGHAPIVVWVHGGGWSSGVNTDIPVLDLLDQGYAIASVEYRFAPDFVHPVPVHDVAAAVSHLASHADRYGVDGATIVLAGHSSGAHLALLAAFTADAPVAGVFAASVWNDLRIDASDPDEIGFWAGGGFTAAAAERQVSRYLGCVPTDCPDRAAEATPSIHATDATMPVLLQHGRDDDLLPVGETEQLGRALVAAGADVTVSLLDGVGHTAVVDATVLAFLARVTGEASATGS